MDQHGGKISVYSAGLNTGCTFTVLLPLFEKSDTKVRRLCPGPVSPVSRLANLTPPTALCLFTRWRRRLKT